MVFKSLSAQRPYKSSFCDLNCTLHLPPTPQIVILSKFQVIFIENQLPSFKVFFFMEIPPGLHKFWIPVIPDYQAWSKFGERRDWKTLKDGKH